MCECAQTADRKLAEHNTAIDWATLIATNGDMQDRLQIKTRKLDPKKRGSATILVATFCPFCGSSLTQESRP